MQQSHRVRPRGNRFHALYRDLKGVEQYAGSYGTWEEANEVGKRKAEWIRGPRDGIDPEVAALMTVEGFVPEFRRHHVVSDTTMGSYVSALRAQVLPRVGKVRLKDVDMGTMRRIITQMREAGASPQMMKYARDVFSALLGCAVQLGYRDTNPVKGLRVPRKPQRHSIPVLTLEQFDALKNAMPTLGAKMFVALVANSGMRFGEITALRYEDIDYSTGRVEIFKAMTEPGKQWCSEGTRFKEVPHTKDGLKRMVFIQKPLARMIQLYAKKSGITVGQRLFPYQLVVPQPGDTGRISSVGKQRPELTPARLDEIEAAHGRYVHPASGRTYRHGGLTAYTKGCKCEWCRQAGTTYYNDRKRRQRLEAQGLPLDTPKRNFGPRRDSDILGRDEWARVFYAACDTAGITATAQALGFAKGPTPYQLRHTHASWMLHDGAEPTAIMKRLGHKDLHVTSLYVQLLDTGEGDVGHLDNMMNWDADLAELLGEEATVVDMGSDIELEDDDLSDDDAAA